MWASNWVSLGISVFRLPEWLVWATWGVVFFEVDFLRAGWGAMGGVGFFGAISAGARVLGWAALKGASFVFRLPETVAACASLAWVATVFRLPTGEAGVAGVVSAFAAMRSLAGTE